MRCIGLFLFKLIKFINNQINTLPCNLIFIILNTMQEGTVKFFNETKGFGFITPNDGGADVFVHTSGLIDRVRENDKVKFETEKGKKGINAVNVQTIG